MGGRSGGLDAGIRAGLGANELMIDIDTSDKREQRNFGLVMAGAITLLGFIRWGLHWRGAESMPTLPVYYMAVSSAFIVLALLMPKVLKPLFVVWMKFANVLNWIVTHIILSLVFFLTVVPIGILMRAFGKKPLEIGLDSKADTYWEDAENQFDDVEKYTKQF
jgi:hypothetical protein